MQLSQYSFKDFLPLILAVAAVLLATGLSLLLLPGVSASIFTAARLFMGFFFLIFGGMKAWNIEGFADAFSMYDPLAKRSSLYARSYPYLEMILAWFYLFGILLIAANFIALVIMTVGAYGVFRKLQEKETIPCACMGAVFTIPMTWVTLVEDLLMAAMAAGMLIVLL